MRQSSQYHIRMVLKISHDYFRQGGIPVELIPEPATRTTMLREGLILKGHQPNSWLLLQEARPLVTAEEAELVFEMHTSSSLFRYVTASLQEEKGYSYGVTSLPEVWKKISVRLPGTSGGQEIQEVHIHLRGQSRFFEFLCIPGYTTSIHPLRLAERTQAMNCTGPEQISLFGHTTAFRFVTTEAVLLRSRQKFRFSLWEVRSSGERLLAHELPLPHPESLSPVSPGDTITTYFYF